MAGGDRTRHDEIRPHRSRLVRGLLIVAGSIAVALAALGAVLPLLPTVPFLLLAAACYARASERFYRRLTESRTFGPSIVAWRTRRCLPASAKRTALILVPVAFGTSAAVLAHRPAVAIAVAAAGLVAFLLIARIPRCESGK